MPKDAQTILNELKAAETEQAFPPPEKGAYGMPQYEKYTENPRLRRGRLEVPISWFEAPGESEEVRHERQKKYYDLLIQEAGDPLPTPKPPDPSKLLT
tara:strand:- start:2015 stop:2308 length:294 start_codon:yes stop_codon:yes gene_type:complete